MNLYDLRKDCLNWCKAQKKEIRAQVIEKMKHMLDNKKHYKKLSDSLKRLLHWYVIRMNLVRNTPLNEHERRAAAKFDYRVERLLEKFPHTDMIDVRRGAKKNLLNGAVLSTVIDKITVSSNQLTRRRK